MAIDIDVRSAAEDCSALLLQRFSGKTARVGIIGMGYVGLPLARAASDAGYRVLGFDIDPAKVEALNAGRSYLRDIPTTDIERMQAAGFEATADSAQLAEADAILICVPTPLGLHHEPDLTYVVRSAEAVASGLRRGQLVVLESTTYPGTTREVVRPILERGGLRCGRDFFLAYSPEREDPGNASYTTRTIPKVVGADDALSRQLGAQLYRGIVREVVAVSSSDSAEAVKILENIFRAVNITMVNELKVIFSRMGIDIWEVIEAAKTKPFGYMPFYPGPGLGGHCIPIDPFYLSWRAREFGLDTRFIELAGQINATMPAYVVERLAKALDARFRKGLNGSRILVVGLAYKKNVADIRESPALAIIARLEQRGAAVDYHDPFVAEIPETRDHAGLAGRRSRPLDPEVLASCDAAVIVTDHDCIDFALLTAHCPLVVDTRNATRGLAQDRVVPA